MEQSTNANDIYIRSYDGFSAEFGNYVEKYVLKFDESHDEEKNNYKHIILWTVNILEAARHLYKAYGFVLTEEVINDTWTKDAMKEERWDLPLV